MKRWAVALIVACGVVGLALPAGALSVGGYTFAPSAFADDLHSVVGDPKVYDYALGTFIPVTTFADIEWATTGSDLTTMAQLDSNDDVTLGFSDNAIVNGPGIDFVIFELDAPELGIVDVGLLGMSLQYMTVWTGLDNGYGHGGRINAIEVDLDDFGLASGALVSLVTVMGDDDFDLAAIGALNSVFIPEPHTAALLALGLLGLGRARRGPARR